MSVKLSMAVWCDSIGTMGSGIFLVDPDLIRPVELQVRDELRDLYPEEADRLSISVKVYDKRRWLLDPP